MEINYSPHKFRHGFATYAIERAVTVADLKAISLNLMHANLTITDGVYGVLSENEVSSRIAKLGESVVDTTEDVVQQLEVIIKMLRK